jgi:large subunit ribosomal protein L13
MRMTTSLKPAETQREWYVVDATDVPLGRLASQVATRLRGKHKANYTPHVDNGDNVVIINADKIRLTGRKLEQLKFFWHTGFPGGIREITAGAELQGQHPQRVVERAVRRMLPRTRLGRAMYTKLHVYAGNEHPHSAQKPTELKFN